MYQIERRHLDRFKIPGAEVSYKLPDGSSSRVKLVDITRSGIRFEINNPVIIGEIIELELIVPKKDKIFTNRWLTAVINLIYISELISTYFLN